MAKKRPLTKSSSGPEPKPKPPAPRVEAKASEPKPLAPRVIPGSVGRFLAVQAINQSSLDELLGPWTGDEVGFSFFCRSARRNCRPSHVCLGFSCYLLPSAVSVSADRSPHIFAFEHDISGESGGRRFRSRGGGERGLRPRRRFRGEPLFGLFACLAMFRGQRLRRPRLAICVASVASEVMSDDASFDSDAEMLSPTLPPSTHVSVIETQYGSPPKARTELSSPPKARSPKARSHCISCHGQRVPPTDVSLSCGPRTSPTALCLCGQRLSSTD